LEATIEGRNSIQSNLTSRLEACAQRRRESIHFVIESLNNLQPFEGYLASLKILTSAYSSFQSESFSLASLDDVVKRLSSELPREVQEVLEKIFESILSSPLVQTLELLLPSSVRRDRSLKRRLSTILNAHPTLAGCDEVTMGWFDFEGPLICS